jgi:isochorismate synthase EntC
VVVSARSAELWVGGGIVSESTAASEYTETEDKAAGWRQAFGENAAGTFRHRRGAKAR